MEELKILIEAIAGLPDLAIWVVAMYFFFKLAVVSSIYAVIRFIVAKLHDWAKTIKESKIVKIETTRDIIEVKQINFGQHYIEDVEEDGYLLFKEMHNWLRDDNNHYGYGYIHSSNLIKLRQAFENLRKENEHTGS